MRKLLATLVASLFVATSGVSLAGGGGPELPLRVSSFNIGDNVLTGTIPGGASAEFVVGPGTIWGPGGDPKQLPPGPCKAISYEWNALASHGRLNLVSGRILLEIMAVFKCSVAVGVPVDNPVGPLPVAQSLRPATN